MKTPTLVLYSLFLFALGCEKVPNPGGKRLPFADPPISMTVGQRSTTPIPGANGLKLTIDDITRSQVRVSISAGDGSAVLSPVSLNVRGSTNFKYDGREYILRLTKLSNALVGQDFASFYIADPASNALAEDEKIEQLLVHIDKMQGAVFIRNGVEHPPGDAAQHLRNKWLLDATPSAVKFIEVHASTSSANGDPYLIRLPGGTTVPLADYLRERLKEIERAR